MNGVDVRNVPQDAAVQVVNRAGDSVKLLIEKNAEELFKKSEFFNLVSISYILHACHSILLKQKVHIYCTEITETRDYH